MSIACVVTQDERQVTANRHIAIVVNNFLIFLKYYFKINIAAQINRKSLFTYMSWPTTV